ncbi:MAG: 50S ribosomal protein L9 [Rhodospirillaceae bacterium]|nr:50S ribosomal protein L9 [Rhodospirillaceae bacterium]
MEVILLERIERLGQMGEVVTVKPGFARNFLFPQKKALRANKDNKSLFESKRVELEATNVKRRDEAQIVARKMDGLKLIIVRQAGEGGQLYGSVSARDIADALKEKGFAVDRASEVLLSAPVKTLGNFKTAVRLHPEVKVDVEFTVARSVEEAKQGIAKAADLLERAEDAAKLVAEGAATENADDESAEIPT